MKRIEINFLQKYRRGLFITIIAVAFTILFYFINSFNDNILINFISDNLWCQTIITFLTITTIINFFYPLTLREELNKKDIEIMTKEIAKKTIIEKENRDKSIRRLIN